MRTQEQQRRYTKTQQMRHGAQINARKRERRITNGERFQKRGITRELFAEALRRQGNVCAICDQPFEGQSHIDHDHATGVFRGVLCPRCNMALGLFRDSLRALYSAIDYLCCGPMDGDNRLTLGLDADR